jgi:hypothetical protein
MYQQWQQDNEYYIKDWLMFVEMVAKEHSITEDVVIRELQKYSWFCWPKE